MSDILGIDAPSTVEAPTVVKNLSKPSVSTRKYVPLDIKSKSKPRKKKKLTTEQIVAIVIIGLVLIGIFFMVLAFVGVFNETGPTVSLTPPLTAPDSKTLPRTVVVA